MVIFLSTQAVVRAGTAGELCKCSLFGYFFNPAQINKINHLMHAAPTLESSDPNPASSGGWISVSLRKQDLSWQQGGKRGLKENWIFKLSVLFGLYGWIVFVMPYCTRIIGCMRGAATSLGDSGFVKALNKTPESRDCS